MMIAMKATVYGLREDERPLFAKEAERFPEIELVLTKEYVTEDSAALAEGADAILITAPCTITPALARRLHGAGVRYILTRSTGFGHIDRQAIQNYGLRAANVPAYSLNAVPEFCLLLTLNLLRNFKRESKMLEKKDFSLSGIQGVSAHNFRKKRAFFVKGATVATKCINKSRTILKRSSGSSLLVLA